jgi:peptidyl-prolyl cis-trans isomerase C
LGIGALVIASALANGCKKDSNPEPAAAATAEQGKVQGAATAEGEPKAEAEPKVEGEAAVDQAHDAAKAEGAAAEPRIEGPVAKVNGQPIAADPYYAELEKIQKHGAKIPDDRLARIKDNILKRLIEAELIRQAIAAEDIGLDDAEIEKAYADYKSRFKTDEQFDNYLSYGKITEADIKDRIREKMAIEKLIDKKGSLAVSDEEAKDFYEKNLRFYQEKESIHASHILVKLGSNATPEEEAEAMKKVEEAQAALKKGEAFEDIATRMSDGPSAPKGGDLGFFTRGQMVKPFEEKAFAMKVGEISEPVRTRFGFHIIKVLEKKEDSQKSFDDVKEQIYESLRNKKFFQERRKLLEDLEKTAKIEKFV